MPIFDTVQSNKYPWLDDNEIKILESDKSWITPTQIYQRMIKEKLAKQERDKKIAAKNAMVFQANNTKNKSMMAQVNIADLDDAIAERGRKLLQAKWIDDIDYTDRELVDMFKSKWWADAYTSILNGKNTIESVTKPKDTSTQDMMWKAAVWWW